MWVVFVAAHFFIEINPYLRIIVMRKKKVVFHSNHCKSKTGFGRHAKALLRYLHNTGKYDIIEYATGLSYSHDALKSLPWKAFGSLPDTQPEWEKILAGLNDHDKAIRQRDVNYGSYNIDKVVKEQKPDVYVGTEDVWAFNGYTDRKWWNKITCALHTTLDSLPILPEAVKIAPDVKNYFVWAKFAEEAMAQMGHDHVKTVHGALEADDFVRLPDSTRKALRAKYGIAEDAFIIGFVFRNQLRKSVVKLLQAFGEFQKKNPQSNAYLLLHTSWVEGWNIPERMREHGIDPSRVLTTYICRNCGEYEIKPYELKPEDWTEARINLGKGQNKDCRFCGAQKPQVTTNVSVGVTEPQLNEIYNLMDVYCHPFTSGGQEIPVQEAKLTELVTLVTDYSCGTEYCTPESGGLPLAWEEYREPGTEFIKASTKVESIVRQLTKVFNMKPQKKIDMGKAARQFVIDNCGIEVVGKFYEEFIDNAPFVEDEPEKGFEAECGCNIFDFDFTDPPKNPDYRPPEISDDKEWLKDIYANILNMYVKDDDDGLKHWMMQIENGRDRLSILKYFIEVAVKSNAEMQKKDFGELFDDNDNKRVLFVIKESMGDCLMATSLFESIRNQYPDHDLYVATQPQFMILFDGNPHIHKIIPYHDSMEFELNMIGCGPHKGYVDVYLHPGIATQRQLNYLSNKSIALDLDNSPTVSFVSDDNSEPQTVTEDQEFLNLI